MIGIGGNQAECQDACFGGDLEVCDEIMPGSCGSSLAQRPECAGCCVERSSCPNGVTDGDGPSYCTEARRQLQDVQPVATADDNGWVSQGSPTQHSQVNAGGANGWDAFAANSAADACKSYCLSWTGTDGSRCSRITFITQAAFGNMCWMGLRRTHKW